MGNKNRWYERNPIIGEAMICWQKAPLPLQRSLAKEVKRMHRRGRLSFRLQQVFSFASLFEKPDMSTLVGKSRWFEKDPVVYESFKILAKADYGELVDLSMRILKLSSHISNQRIDVRLHSPEELDRLVTYVFENANWQKVW